MANTPAKGEKGGECNRTACDASPAFWFNSSTRAYYCVACAARINYWSKRDHEVILCKNENPVDELDAA